MSAVDDPLDVRVSTVGSALPETEVKIVKSSGETAPAGEQGELCTRGYLVMKGYDAEEEATRKAIDAEGWLHTGDLAVMREDGKFRITGRARDMIIRGGENIYPREIEEFLYSHPKIADVQVLGLPDAKLGESVLAWVRLKTGETLSEDEQSRAFQNPAADSVRGFVPHDHHRQDSKIQNSRDGDRAAGTGSGGDDRDSVIRRYRTARQDESKIPGSASIETSGRPPELQAGLPTA